MKRTTKTLLAAAGAGLGWALWHHERHRHDIVGSQAGFGRNAAIARVGARTGARWATIQARKTFASVERRDALDAEFELKTTEEVVQSLGNLKGAMMKVGQMASYLDLGLPPAARQTLAQLQADAPPMSAELAAGVIVDELGSHPDDLFEEWDPQPIASASIGQVHRAITRDGRAVAVKVQYPGVADAIDSDLRTNDTLFAGLKLLFPGLDSAAVTDELRQRLSEELDYELEARNQTYFAEHFEGHPFIHVPSVVAELSTMRVLTSDLAVGATFDEVREWSQEEKDLAAETLFRFSFGAIYRLTAFNGDPHPGNYLFRPGGHITFLDFGLVKRFTEEETDLFAALIIDMVIDHDMAGFRRHLENANLLPPGAPFSDEAIGDYFSFFYDFVRRDEHFTIDEDYSAAGVRQIFDSDDENAELKKILNVPPSFVVLQRINLGLMSLFAQLESTQNWRRIAEELWPFVEAGPSTPMGETIERWGRDTGRRPSYEGL